MWIPTDAPGRPGPPPRVTGLAALGLVRLVHPFPIVLDALATTAIAVLAGASTLVALRLGVGMLLLQASIGALNDVVDAPRDAGLKPGKPIPAGHVSMRAGRVVASATGLAGLAVSAVAGPDVLLVAAAAVLVVGYTYDLRLKGTAWSWLPFAVGIPLLPVYAWLGATGQVPAVAGVLLPAAFLAGAALAIANALPDVERDRAADVSSIVDALGASRAWRLHVALHAGVFALAGLSLALLGEAALPGLAAIAVPALVVGVGAGLAGSPAPERRERGWELEALGIAALAAAWLSVVTL